MFVSMNELVVPELAGFLNMTSSFGVLLVNVSNVATDSVIRAMPRLRTGAVLGGTTRTITFNSSYRGGAPLSVTRIVIVFVLNPLGGGVQEKTPVLGLIVAPLGMVPTKLNVSVLVGISSSE